MKSKVTLGAWAGFWGDSPQALRQVLDVVGLDYLVSDYLAEVSMALLARAKAKDPAGAGYITEAVDLLVPALREIAARGIKVVTNAGALNPAGCAEALRVAIARAELDLEVACVLGDDLSPRVEELRHAGVRDSATGETLPAGVITVNAYLGATPVARALDMGADIVVTGRSVDSAVVLGPLMHEFGWRDDEFDLLSAGTLAGHLIECGPQGVGGLFSDWWSVPGWEDMGYPVAECYPDGSAVITKPAGTGGLVVPGSVAEQMLYEIGDPGAYVMPDVVCDWRDVELDQAGPDRVRIRGAKGRPPTSTYKATATCADGWRVVSTALFAGGEAAARARRAGRAILDRAERVCAKSGIGPFEERSVEIVGGGDLSGRPGAFDDAREAVLKVGARHPDKRALDVLATEMISLGFVAQSYTGVLSGRPKPAPAVRLLSLLLPKSEVPVSISFGKESVSVAIAPGAVYSELGTAPLTEAGALPSGELIEVPLRRLAWARSGDKGNHANIGVIARRTDFVSLIHGQVTAERVRGWFGDWVRGRIARWALPGCHAINILLEDALGGRGGTTSLRYDPQGKALAATLLDMPIQCPAAWVRSGLLAEAHSRDQVQVNR